jgi:hypothetical protein
MSDATTTCPGCGLRLPADPAAVYDGYYHVAPECWRVYTEVLGREFGDAVLFGQVHQLTVDSYALQHAGGGHPDKSIAVHLAGLHLMLEHGNRPPDVAPLLHRLASRMQEWPHFPPPAERGALTVHDVLDAADHAATVRAWAREVWSAWADHHAAVAAFVARPLA